MSTHMVYAQLFRNLHDMSAHVAPFALVHDATLAVRIFTHNFLCVFCCSPVDFCFDTKNTVGVAILGCDAFPKVHLDALFFTELRVLLAKPVAHRKVVSSVIF